MNATNFADEKASVDEKRAAAERFSMTVCENGYVNVCNESHNDDSDHTYSVEVTDGKATGCPCLHAVHRGAHCKHQIAVENARNLALVAASGDVQPVTYAVGDHDRASEAPNGDRITVLTGANSGGKTTLLETLCQVVLLAHMGLPVPAERAEVNRFDAIVFHRRHASFNAGVLESTLRTIVPPLTKTDRINQFRREIDVAYKTVHQRVQRFMRALDAPVLDLIGPVEIDEVYVSAGKKGRERDGRSHSRGLSMRGRGSYKEDKPPIICSG